MISLIVAKSINNVIGIDNQIPWHIPEDLQYFKAITGNHTVIMGRKTFESIGQPLANRNNIVVSATQPLVDGITVVVSIEEALAAAKKYEGNTFFIGGGQIYKEALRYVDTMFITEVYSRIENGTAFFPEINKKEWSVTSFDKQVTKDNLAYRYKIYGRKR